MTEQKQRKLELNPATSTNMDRISSLPDSLLCYILSFLPTNTSVSTSILSRRWRYLWEHVQVFSFSDGSSAPRVRGAVAKCIVPFVNAVLALRKFREIQKFSLSCAITDNDITKTWIRAAIGPHLQELHLSLNSWENDFRLPHRVFTCTALVSLALVGAIVLEELPLVHLPSLKNLEVNISRMVPVDKLFAGCPVLETLTFGLYNENPHKICMPSSVKRLIFEYISEYDIDELDIDTPSLEYLNINVMNTCLQFSVRNLDNVVEADISLYGDTYVSFVPRLLRALCKTKRLMLNESATEGLLRAPTRDFPLFSCLIHLQLGDLCFNSRFLIDLLHNCHMLQVLIISRVSHGETSEPWNQPTNVPKCVTAHLASFEFGGYEDFADEHAFIAYILENGLVLKTMTIHRESHLELAEKESPLELEKKDRILRRISALPRGSNVCQLKFD